MITFPHKTLVIAVSLLFFVNASGNTSSSPNTIHFGIMALKPYGFFDKNQQPQGDLYEITQAILRQENFQGKVVIASLNRLVQSLLVEKVLDCSIYGTVPFVKDSYNIIESTGIMVEFGILPRKGIVINRYEDLKDLRIGHPLGVNIGGPYDKDNSLTKVFAKNYETGMLMLKHNRFDAIAGVIGSLKYGGRTRGVTSESYGTPYITKRLPMVVACRPNFADKEILEKLRKVVIELRESGEIQRIFESYHGD